MSQCAIDCSTYCSVLLLKSERAGSACEKQAERPIFSRPETVWDIEGADGRKEKFIVPIRSSARGRTTRQVCFQRRTITARRQRRCPRDITETPMDLGIDIGTSEVKV